jgi:hypothetical protein
MLDVHPPHEAAHTWKDFLIHIATIVISWPTCASRCTTCLAFFDGQ